jgi:hypothetical protein
MSRSNTIHRWMVVALLAGATAIGAAGCIAVPVGGGYPEAGIGFPAPGVFIAPPPIVFGGGRSNGYYRGRAYGRQSWGRGNWR